MNSKLNAIFVNSAPVEPRAAPGAPALDFIRGELGLLGTKEGCREGDCGACAVLVGEARGGAVLYRAMPSCLLAAGDLAGRHLITIEGLSEGAQGGLTPVMRAIVEANGSQCGFCTPGFVVSLTAWLAESERLDAESAARAVDGNLCRCTGYASIRRAAQILCDRFADLPSAGSARLRALVEATVLPGSALEFQRWASRHIKTRAGTAVQDLAKDDESPSSPGPFIAGGTDYYVRNPDPDPDFSPRLLRSSGAFGQVTRLLEGTASWVSVGASVSVRDFFASALVREALPGIEAFEREFASLLIRNLASVGGNIANASPVGDLTAMLLAAGAQLEISESSGGAARRIPLERFFLGYKEVDLREGEFVSRVFLPLENATETRFSFEKIAKRRNLDIAAVNTALKFRIEEGLVRDVRLSAGGVAPVPRLLRGAAACLEGSPANPREEGLSAAARAMAETAMEEVSPIDDVRGSAGYRRRMLKRLVLAHFVRLFPGLDIGKELAS